MTTLRKTLLFGGLLLVAAAVAAVVEPQLARPATPPASPATITVSGEGTAKAVPDRASFDFGVQTKGTTAAAALSENSRQAGAIVAALENAGVHAADIQTTEVSLWPQTTSDGTTIVGYQASNSVQATVPVPTAGATVDAAVAAGANNVDGPNLSVADKSSADAAALKQALANARTKAQAIAADDGVTLGAVQTVTEGSPEQGPFPLYASASLAAPAPRIQAGTQEMDATVTVTYATG
jgi:uncharacterized protein YggE